MWPGARGTGPASSDVHVACLGVCACVYMAAAGQRIQVRSLEGTNGDAADVVSS